MTEAEWLGCADPLVMLDHVLGLWRAGRRVSDRSLLLFAVAIARLWGMMSMNAQFDSRALEKAERYADGQARKKDLQNHWKDPSAPVRSAVSYVADVALAMNQCRAQFPERDVMGQRDEVARICDFFRVYFGNPFRPVTLAPCPLTPTIASLARGAYDERILRSGEMDPLRLSVLADALEEAGAATELVAHLRGPGPHIRGCFAVDLCLGLIRASDLVSGGRIPDHIRHLDYIDLAVTRCDH